MSVECALCNGTGRYEYRYPELGDDPETQAVTEALLVAVKDKWTRENTRWHYVEQASRAIRALDAFRAHA